LDLFLQVSQENGQALLPITHLTTTTTTTTTTIDQKLHQLTFLQSYIFVESTKTEQVATTATSTHGYMIFQTAKLPPKLNIQLQNPIKGFLALQQPSLSLSLSLSL
jgi:hypothetical protein